MQEDHAHSLIATAVTLAHFQIFLAVLAGIYWVLVIYREIRRIIKDLKSKPQPKEEESYE